MVQELGLREGREVGVLHVFDAPSGSLLVSASMTATEIERQIAEGKARAAAELEQFLRTNRFARGQRFVVPMKHSAAQAIRDCSHEWHADPIVLGTHGRLGVGRILLGSVAEDVLRESTTDVLTVSSSAGNAAQTVSMREQYR